MTKRLIILGTLFLSACTREDAAYLTPLDLVDGGVPSTGDQLPPTFAGATSATAAPSSMTVRWNAATDNRTDPTQITYLVYQAETAGGEVLASPTFTTAPGAIDQATASGAENYTMPSYTTLAGATSYTVTGLNANSTYYFVVRAQDEAGNIGANLVERSAMTVGVSLSGQVQPIFAKSCLGNGCHSGASPAQALDLGSASASYSNLVNVASSQCAATKRVLPSAPDQSYLVWKIKGTGSCFVGSRMPKGQQLSAADQNTIRSWITLGACCSKPKMGPSTGSGRTVLPRSRSS